MPRKFARRFADIADALRRSVEFAYDLRRKNKGKDIPYDGPPITTSKILANAFSVEEAFTDEMLRGDEERGRDAMATIIGKALQLGMEQGWRMVTDDGSARMDLSVIRLALEEGSTPHIRERALKRLDEMEELAKNPFNLRHDKWPTL